MPKVSKSCLILGSIVLLLFVCVGAAYITLWTSTVGDAFRPGDCLSKSGNSISPLWFKDFAGFDVPPSARNISATCEAFQDYVAYVRLTIDPNDLTPLIASSFVKTPLSSTQKPFDMTTHISDLRRIGWNIQSISSYLAGEANVSTRSLHQSILIDTSNASEYVVYIVTFA